jgi:two-component SAPR family response regulator
MDGGPRHLPYDFSPDVVVQEQPIVRVLHVDDDETITRAVARVLRKAGYHVVSVHTADEAIVQLSFAIEFDVVVSDFDLKSGGTGAEVLLAAGTVPFMFLCSDERADAFGVPRLDKPASATAIREAVSALL